MRFLSNQPRRSRPGASIKKPSLDFSITGLVFTCMLVFMGLAAINSQANLLFGVFGLMIGVLLIAGVISRIVLRRLEVRRVLPDVMTVGEPATIHYEFDNRKRFWPSFSVSVGELSGSEAFTRQPQAYLLHAAAGTRARVPMTAMPTRRGLHQLEHFQLSTSFPFGFVRRAVDRRQHDAILVHPPRAEVDQRLLSLCLSAEQSGARMRPQRGGTDEFYGVKEYRTGENPRFIYWRRSARMGTLISKEMSRIAPPRLLVLVDSFIAERTLDEHAAVEKAIAMAASLVLRTLDSGMAVGLLAWFDGWVAVPPSRGKRHCRDLLAMLARLPLNTAHTGGELLKHAHRLLRSGTTAVLITPRDTEASLACEIRPNWLVLPVRSEQTQRWFRFDPAIDFSQCVPPQQAPPAPQVI